MPTHPLSTRRLFTALALCLLVWTACAGCGPLSSKEKRPVAVKGVIDLRNWDFERDGAINLNGEWEFCWDRGLTSTDFVRIGSSEGCGYISVPGSWKDHTHFGAPLPGAGRATYRLRALFAPTKRTLTITIRRVFTAYRLWINGVLADSKGVMDESPRMKEDFSHVHDRRSSTFEPRAGVNEIVLQVSNRDYASGGIDQPIRLSNTEYATQREFLLHTLDMIIVGILLFSAIYNILFFFSRRRDIAPLYIGLTSLALALNTYNIQHPVLSTWLPHWANPLLVNHLTIITGTTLFLMIAQSIFPGKFPTPILKLSLAVSACFSGVLVFTRAPIAERIIGVFYIIGLVWILFFAYGIFTTMLKNRDEVVFFFIGLMSILLAGINNFLYSRTIIDTGNMLSYSMVIFCIMSTFVVSRRFARALETVEKMSRELTEKNIALEKADRLKDQFLANTSHELRTPLHGMIGLSNSLLEGAAGGLSARTRDIIALIAASGTRLANMVNDLLDMAKIHDEGLPLDLRPVDLHAVSTVVVRLALPLLGERPVEIVNRIGPDLPCAWADEDRVRQVLSNLVGNAIKFTNEGSIDLTALVVNRTDKNGGPGPGAMIEVRVIDTGIGVPEDHRESIFDAYRQADGSDTRTYGGIGLGLAIAKRIVEAHHGSIWMTPGERGGSVFTFTLPVVDAAPLNSQEGYGIKEASGDPRPDTNAPDALPEAICDAAFDGSPVVLAVDDDPVNLTVLRGILEPRGCIVRTAANGISALDLIERDDSIRLVLLDIMMPIMSGFEICRRIRANRSPGELPVIMLTAKNMMTDIDAAFAAGANDYIMKPFQPAELLARAGTMLAFRKVRRAMAESLTVRDGGTAYSIRFDDIVFITAHLKNIVVHTVNGEVELPIILKDFSDRLPPDIFIRIHKSHIVNLRYIHSVSHVLSGRYKVRLLDENETELPVGAAYLESLRKKI